ncbi:hypothetical protein NL533_33125, partial [Klebsiella pneumoniae]|nr:hypothetical protein [Klebsiella pneumoniae]
IMLGDKGTALTRLTWILSMAEDPGRRQELERADLTQEIARAYMYWVECARFLPEMPTAQLFEVLEAGDRYLRGVGKPGWRAGLLD